MSSKNYDVMIIGAGFAGLLCARVMALRGLKTLVIERKESLRQRIHTTGIFVKEALEYCELPRQLYNVVPHIRLYAPNGKHIDLQSKNYYFCATNTGAVLEYLADQARQAGAEIRLDTAFHKIDLSGDGVILPDLGLQARLLVGCDGAKSQVAAACGLGRNQHFLVGLEHEYKNLVGYDPKFLHCFLDSQLAPGYIGWLVPGCEGITQIGIAARRADKPQLAKFQEKLAALFDFSQADLVGKRSGVIPTGGLVKPFIRDKVVLIGDAAGIVSPLTAGGIYTALVFGTKAGQAIADYLQYQAPHPEKILAKCYPRFRMKSVLRRFLNLAPANFLFNHSLNTAPMRKLAQYIYFHNK